jgi:hypothetical protein
MYDEDDERAMSKVCAEHALNYGDTWAAVYVEDSFIDEFVALKYWEHMTHITSLSINTESSQDTKSLDCSVLAHFAHLEYLDLHIAKPKDWEFARSLNLKELKISLTVLKEVNFACMPKLNKLEVENRNAEEVDYNLAERIPKHVKSTIIVRSAPAFCHDFPNITWTCSEGSTCKEVCGHQSKTMQFVYN